MSRIECPMPMNNIIVLGSYFNLRNKYNHIDRFFHFILFIWIRHEVHRNKYRTTGTQ